MCGGDAPIGPSATRRITQQEMQPFDDSSADGDIEDQLSVGVEKTHERALEWWFRAGCFFYSFVGLHMASSLGILTCECSSYPWQLEAALLIGQGILSFLHDAYFVGLSPTAKVADRTCATFLTLCQPMKFAFCAMDAAQWFILLLFWTLGLLCFMAGKRCHSAGDAKRYQIWHTLWHLALPLGGCLWIEYTRYLAPCGGFLSDFVLAGRVPDTFIGGFAASFN